MGLSDKRKPQNQDVYTILLLQSMQISETAGAACHKEVFQCPARWIISITENVIEMAVREQGAKARVRVLHFGEELFATVGAAKHGYDALNMRNVFRKILKREGDVAKKGQWRRVVELRLQFIVALNLITGTQYLVCLSSLLAEERSYFLQVA